MPIIFIKGLFRGKPRVLVHPGTTNMLPSTQTTNYCGREDSQGRLQNVTEGGM